MVIMRRIVEPARWWCNDHDLDFSRPRVAVAVANNAQSFNEDKPTKALVIHFQKFAFSHYYPLSAEIRRRPPINCVWTRIRSELDVVGSTICVRLLQHNTQRVIIQRFYVYGNYDELLRTVHAALLRRIILRELRNAKCHEHTFA